MSEDFNSQNNNEYNNEPQRSWSDGNKNTLKFLTLCLCAFLGGMAGMGLIGSMLAPKHHPHPFKHPPMHHSSGDFRPMEDIDFFDDFEMNTNRIKREYSRELKKFDRDMDKLSKAVTKSQNVTFEETDDEYIVKVDLSKLNNDEKNVELKIEPNYIKVSGKYDEKADGKNNYTSFVNSRTLDDKVDIKAVKQEREGHKLVITLPKAD